MTHLEVLLYVIDLINTDLFCVFLQYLVSVLLAVAILRYSGILRNKFEDEKYLKKCDTVMGKQFARTNFSWLENVIKGKNGGPTHIEMLTEYLNKEQLPGSAEDVVCPKVFLMFPFSLDGRFNGSVEQLLKKSKHEYPSEDFSVKFREVELPEYIMKGQRRKSTLSVVKFRNRSTGGFLYAVIAENRLLTSLQKMMTEPGIRFNVDNYKLQFEIYVEEMRTLLDCDPMCRNSVEIIQFNEEDNLSEIFEREITRLSIHNH
ncbi:uncharacterized protein LOC111712485 [Eurytemora carolleeae]|uniref:uncharacterized protein LOC111712485 n=1 Tax=Eurytemora carolleeae TaxID=1294199 RepID=UPI000C771B19|nr:uncharacterized protein LOC111712485 [Eurytemora carolleeae]|eukprot:XP_023342871.1 uncharacterized protein LOC111712485 [Eurytemora affinis]